MEKDQGAYHHGQFQSHLRKSTFYFSIIAFQAALFHKFVAESSTMPEVLKIGMMFPYRNNDSAHYRSLVFEEAKTAVAIAERTVVNDPNLLPGLQKFEVRSRDSACQSMNGGFGALDLVYSDKPHLFLGPVCDFVVGKVAGWSSFDWKIPVVSPGAFDLRLSNKTEYSMLVRVGGTFPNLWEPLKNIWSSNSWGTVGFLLDKNEHSREHECYFTLVPVFGIAKSVLGAKNTPASTWSSDKNDWTYPDLLRQMSTKSRSKYHIYYIFFPNFFSCFFMFIIELPIIH